MERKIDKTKYTLRKQRDTLKEKSDLEWRERKLIKLKNIHKENREILRKKRGVCYGEKREKTHTARYRKHRHQERKWENDTERIDNAKE